MDSVKDESILKHLNVEAALCQIWPVSIAKDFHILKHWSNQEKLWFKGILKLYMPCLFVFFMGTWWQSSRRTLTLSWELSVLPTHLLSFPQSICSSLKGHEEGPQNSDTVKKHKWHLCFFETHFSSGSTLSREHSWMQQPCCDVHLCDQ